MSSSALPYVRKAPTWLRMSKDDIIDSIVKLAKKGYRPSAIGVQIRDQYGVSQSKYVTGNKVLRILKAQGMSPESPDWLDTTRPSPLCPPTGSTTARPLPPWSHNRRFLRRNMNEKIILVLFFCFFVYEF